MNKWAQTNALIQELLPIMDKEPPVTLNIMASALHKLDKHKELSAMYEKAFQTQSTSEELGLDWFYILIKQLTFRPPMSLH